MQNFHEVLQLKPEFPVVDSLDFLPFMGLEYLNGNNSSEFARVREVLGATDRVLTQHLGYITFENLVEMVHGGFDVGFDVFFGNWWTEHEESEMVKNEELSWHDPFIQSCILGMLGNQWEKVSELGGWLCPNKMESYIGHASIEEAMVLILIAAHLTGEKMGGADSLCEKVEKCRLKRPKLLLSVLDSVIAQDQQLFDRGMHDLLKHYDKSCHPSDFGNFTDVVCLPSSILYAVGRKNGLEQVELPERLIARIVTHESVGLEFRP